MLRGGTWFKVNYIPNGGKPNYYKWVQVSSANDKPIDYINYEQYE